MSTVRISQPSVEPVTLAEAKLHLRVDHDVEDQLISGYIASARALCEKEVQRTLITTGWRLTLPGFPCLDYQRLCDPVPMLLAQAIRLHMGDVQSVSNVTYLDPDGVQRTLSPTAYELQSWAGQWLLAPAHGASWPATQSGLQSVTVDYLAGYGATSDSVPAPLRSWILLAVGDLYSQRLRSGDKPAVPHQFVDGLLDAYKVWG